MLDQVMGWSSEMHGKLSQRAIDQGHVEHNLGNQSEIDDFPPPRQGTKTNKMVASYRAEQLNPIITITAQNQALEDGG